MGRSTSLPPYPAYKPSGVEWLGDIPAHWDLRRLRDSVLDCVGGVWGSEPNGVDDLPCVRVTDFDRQRLRVRMDTPTVRAIAPSERRQRILTPGDLLLEKSGGGDLQPVGVVMLYDHGLPAVCSNFVALLRVRTGFDSVFLTFLHSALYALRLNVRSIKQTTGIQNLDTSAYLNERVCIPPLAEQRTIARYLDHVDRRIRRYIKAKEKLITLLQEARQSIIQRAVTRGLDPDVLRKPSGVDWLGDVPAHWEVRRLKTLCSMKSGDGISVMSIESTGEYPVYGGNGLRGYTLDYNHDGSFVLIGRQGALCGNVHIAQGKFWATEHAVVATHDTGHNVVWFGAILTAMNLNQYSIAAAQPGLAIERILNLHLPVPPVQEQEQIAAHLDKATAAIDAAIDNARRQVERMTEYRASLIAHVVTGKLDVRGAAASLSPESAEQEPVGKSPVS